MRTTHGVPALSFVLVVAGFSLGLAQTGFGPDSTPPPLTPYRSPKSPLIACGLSYLLPGGGQFYNDEPQKGLVILGMAGYGAGVMVYAAAAGAGSYGDYERRQRLEVVGYIGAALYVGAGLWSMIDAPLSAMDINRRAGRTDLLLHPARDGLGLGLSARF